MEQRKIPVEGEIYKDVKGNEYQVHGVATHSGTLEPMVVYREQKDEDSLYVCPLKDFMSGMRSTVTEEKTEEASEETQDGAVRAEILRFLDADGADKKLKVLREIRNDLDEEILTTMELSLDILPDGRESMERRLDLIERTLEQKLRFEGGRLR